MARLLPSLDLLRGFEAAARQLSFTKAAAELFLTQSAVSRQVQTLEEQLGTPLFERHHRQIRLTPAGQKLFRAAGDAMRLLTETAMEIRDGPASSLTVSCTMGFASLWLVPRLMDFRDRASRHRHPHRRQQHGSSTSTANASNWRCAIARGRIWRRPARQAAVR